MRQAYTLACVVALCSGCASIQDCHYEKRNELRTQLAWLEATRSPLCWVAPSDYGRGWKQGYFNLAMGGSSQPPALPPKSFWSADYQSPQGQEAIAAWYQGYQDGATYAEAHGVGAFHYLHSAGVPCAVEGHPPAMFPSPSVNPEALPPGVPQSDRAAPAPLDQQSSRNPARPTRLPPTLQAPAGPTPSAAPVWSMAPTQPDHRAQQSASKVNASPTRLPAVATPSPARQAPRPMAGSEADLASNTSGQSVTIGPRSATIFDPLAMGTRR